MPSPTTTAVAADVLPPQLPEPIDRREADWAFCWQRLVEVSRTFSKPIEMLPPNPRVATTCGYLLCRVADTIEDDAALTTNERGRLFEALLEVLEDGASAAHFCELAQALDGRPAELVLARNLDRVLHVFGQLPTPMQAVCTQWIGEMIRGMSLYGHRTPNADGLVMLTTVSDLERYCYFVAGTVGQMLTGLFSEAIADLDEAGRRTLARHAEDFGLALQMVNILKDQTDDLARGWSFIPATLWDAQDTTPRRAHSGLALPAAHAAVEPVFEQARLRLNGALEYTLAIPAEHTGIRLFCLLPLWMAVRTLVLAHGNDAIFAPDQPVKISRSEVGELIGSASEHVGDDDALRRIYASLWEA